jgi:hypothetical protein
MLLAVDVDLCGYCVTDVHANGSYLKVVYDIKWPVGIHERQNCVLLVLPADLVARIATILSFRRDRERS